jgi:hypothetical protein
MSATRLLFLYNVGYTCICTLEKQLARQQSQELMPRHLCQTQTNLDPKQKALNWIIAGRLA